MVIMISLSPVLLFNDRVIMMMFDIIIANNTYNIVSMFINKISYNNSGGSYNNNFPIVDQGEINYLSMILILMMMSTLL